MSEFKFSCPHCGQHFQGEETWAGQVLPCPSCQKSIVVPRPAHVPIPPPTATSRPPMPTAPGSRASAASSSVAPKTSGLAIASLALSLGTMLIGPLGFIPGIVCGHLARRQIKRDSAVGGRGLATSGLIVGYGFLGLTVVALTAFLFIAAKVSRIQAEMARQRATPPAVAMKGERPVRPASPTRQTRRKTVAPPMANLAGAVSGTIGGQNFRGAAAELNKTVGTLRVDEGRAVPRGERMTIFLFPKKGEPFDGKTWKVSSDSAPPRPHVHLNWYEGDQAQSKAVMDGYDLELRFGTERDGQIDGHLKLKLSGTPATEVEGDFVAKVQ